MEDFSNKINAFFLSLQFGNKERISFYRKLVSLLGHGVSLINVLGKVLEAYKKRDMMKTANGVVILDVYNNLRLAKGENVYLSDAVRKYASDSEVMLIRAGDESGLLVEGLEQAVYVTESIMKIKSTVIGKLAYPAVLLTVLFGVYMLFAMMLLPPVADMLSPDKWNPLGHAMYSVLHVFEAYWIYMIVGIVALVFLLSYLFPRWVGESRDVADKFFPFNVYREISSSTFLVALSSLMSSGVPMKKSLMQIKESASPYLSGHIDKMSMNMSRGVESGAVLDTGLFNQDVSVDLEVFGNSGDFESSLKIIAEETIANVISFVGAIGNAANFATLIAIGASIIFLIGGFYDVINQIKTMA